MKCSCPKCHAKIELDLLDAAEEGTSASCPECKAGFTVHRESFGARALRKSGDISCASCGNELGPQLRCQTCGLPFPDYLVAGVGRKRARRSATKLKLKSSPLPKPAKTISQLPTLENALRQESHASAKKEKVSAGGSFKILKIAVGVIVLLALIGGGTAIYFQKMAEANYMRNFTLATYGVQLGADKSRKVCQRIAADWKAKSDAGQSFTPRPSVEEIKGLNSIKVKIESVKAKLIEEPDKFKNCNENLVKIQAAYDRLQSLALLPGNSLPAFTDASNKLDGEYNQAASQFKAAVPPELMEELRSASLKYRGLRPLLK
jgi:hypothetical protein